MTSAMTIQEASRVAHDLFSFRESSSDRSSSGYQTITLKEAAVLNGDTHLPKNTKLYVELAPAGV